MAWDLKVEAISGNGNSAAWDHVGGMCTCAFVGTFSSGTAKLQFSPDDGSNFYDVDATNAALTADGVFDVQIAACKLRVNLAGASSPDVDVYYQQYDVRYF